METRIFRGLMLLSLALLLAAVSVAWPVAGTPPAQTGDVEFSAQATFGATYSILWAVFYVASFIGMFLFRPWGRLLSLVAALLLPTAALVPALIFGEQSASEVEPAASTALQQLSDLSWGAVIALAYFSQIRHQFGANSSFKQKPLRGSA